MDVSFEEQQVDTVVADLNRMKQGMKCRVMFSMELTVFSSGKFDHQCHKVYLKEEGKKKYNCVYGRISKTTHLISSQRRLL